MAEGFMGWLKSLFGGKKEDDKRKSAANGAAKPRSRSRATNDGRPQEELDYKLLTCDHHSTNNNNISTLHIPHLFCPLYSNPLPHRLALFFANVTDPSDLEIPAAATHTQRSSPTFSSKHHHDNHTERVHQHHAISIPHQKTRASLRMNATRPFLRAGFARQALHTQHNLRTPLQRRFQSTANENARSFHPAAVGGIAGGVAAFATCYLYYQFSGAKTLVKGAQDTKKYLDSVQAKFQESTPNPNEALKWLRQTASSYAGFVPGASGVVNTAFDEVDKIHDSHREEVDKIINDAYAELKQVSQKGLNVEAAKQGWDIILKHLRRVHNLAGDVMNEVLDRHPEVKDQVGKPIEQLRQMGDRLGPEAKQVVDTAWKQAHEIVNNNEGGVLSPANIGRVQKIIDEATDKLRKYGDEAWKKAMDQAKPYLDKSPQVKKLVEENVDHLKSGNAKELYEKVKQAVDSGDTSDLQNYVKNAASKAQSSSMGSLQQYLDKIPNGSQIIPNLGKLQEVAQKHGKEAEELFKSTVHEISEVLSKKADEARKIGEGAEKTAGVGEGEKTQKWFGKKG